MTPKDKHDPMDEEAVLATLNAALPLQLRSALSYTLVAGTLVGFDLHAIAVQLQGYADAELHDARHLVEKITTLGGAPTTDVAGLEHHTGVRAIEWLIASETEAVETLKRCITPTGQEGRSEALEHRLEHMIMRKQEQIDTLIRASRQAGG